MAFTKRSLLRFTAKIFDLLGLLSLFVIQLKVLFQRLYADQTEYNDLLQDETLEEWKSIIPELHCLNRIKVPRYQI